MALLVRGSHDEQGDGDDDRMGDLLYRLVEAADPEEAYRKAIELGAMLVDPYTDDDGSRWTLRFLGLADLTAMAEEEPADGVEVYSELISKRPSDRVVPKEQLTVFEPDEPPETEDAEESGGRTLQEAFDDEGPEHPPPAGLHVRIALPEDAAAVSSAEWTTEQTPGLLVGEPGEIPLEAFRDKIEELEQTGRYVVAEKYGAVLGHAFLDPMPMRANSHVFRLTIVVHPDHRRRGIGRKLMDDLLGWANGDPRVGKVELLVRSGNEVALRLYRAIGFVEEGRLRGRVRLPDGTDVDDVAMAWFPQRGGAA